MFSKCTCGFSTVCTAQLHPQYSLPNDRGTLALLQAFYEDFAHVADDESRHLRWCLQRLRELDHDYGCMPAHNMLWEGAEKSAGKMLIQLCSTWGLGKDCRNESHTCDLSKVVSSLPWASKI